MSLRIVWRQQVIQSAKPYHLQDEVLAIYDALEHLEPDVAAFQACYEWDIPLKQLTTDTKMKRILQHDDHNLPQEVIDWGFDQLENFLETTEFLFCAHTFTIPDHFPDLENALYGPLAGDPPVEDSEVTLVVRGDRPWTDRIVAKPPRPSRQLTVIGTILDGDLVAFTMHGGPLADRNPADPTNPNPEQSKIFWSQHALAGA